MKKQIHILIFSGAALLVGNLLLRLSGVSVWDDAYFFVRYADHFWEQGSWSWNPAGPGSYGLTSVAHGAELLLWRLLGGPPALTLLLCSLVAGLSALWMCFRLLAKAEGSPGNWKAAAFLVLLAGLQAPQLATHLLSGMDTALAMLYMAAWLYFFQKYVPQLSPGKALILGLLGGLAYFVRPELLIFTLGLPLSLALFSKNKTTQTQAWYTLLFAFFMLLSQALIALSLFGDLIPLSFYAKSGGAYGNEFTFKYQRESIFNWLVFVGLNVVPLLIWIRYYFRLSIPVLPKGFHLWERSMMVLFLLYWIYETGFVLQVMGQMQRFYYPAWPVMLYLAWRSWNLVWGGDYGFTRFFQHWKWSSIVTFLVAGLVFTAVHRPANVRQNWGRFDTAFIYTALGQNNWAFLDRFSGLPADLKIASTELGILGIMNPEKEIVDLCGLQDPKGAVGPGELIAQKVDLVYLPHPDYKEMNQVLALHNGFQDQYLVYSAKEINSWMGIALRKEGPYYFQLKNIVEEKMNP